MCGLAPDWALPYHDSVAHSCSRATVIATERSSRAVIGSPSPGRTTIPSIAPEYDGRATARVSPSNAEEGAARSWDAAAGDNAVRGAARALVILVPRRSVAAGGARRPRGRARAHGNRAHRSRRRLRLARVRARRQAL